MYVMSDQAINQQSMTGSSHYQEPHGASQLHCSGILLFSEPCSNCPVFKATNDICGTQFLQR